MKINKQNIMAFAIALITTLFASCTREDIDNINENSKVALQINASASFTQSKAIIEDYFSSGAQIGVNVSDESSGSTYDGTSYVNKCFTASGTTTSQQWLGNLIYLSTTNASINAYYPYSESVTDLRGVPVSSGDTDYMYATQVDNINSSNNQVNLSMNHALACIRLTLKTESYSGTGELQAITVQGEQIAQSASLNAFTGEVYNLETTNYQLSESSLSQTLSSSAVAYDFIVVHSNDSETINFTITIDGSTYNFSSSALQLSAGTIYQFDATLSGKAMAMGEVIIKEWNYSEDDYSYTLGNNYELVSLSDDILFNIAENNGIVTINAITINEDDTIQYTLTSGSATIVESNTDISNLITLTISNITESVVLTFEKVEMCIEYTVVGTNYVIFFNNWVEISSDNDSWQVDFGDGTTSETGLTMSQILEIEHEYTDGLNEHTIRYYNSSNDVKITGIDAYQNTYLTAFTKCDYDCSQLLSLYNSVDGGSDDLREEVGAFYQCIGLADISGLSGTNNLMSIQEAFAYCENLEDITPLANNFNIENVSRAFFECSGLTTAIEWWDDTTYPNIISNTACYGQCNSLIDYYDYLTLVEAGQYAIYMTWNGEWSF